MTGWGGGGGGGGGTGILFWSTVHRLPRTLRYVCECFCELLGSIILSVCLVWGVVASLAVFLLVYQYGKIEISLAIPK